MEKWTFVCSLSKDQNRRQSKSVSPFDHVEPLPDTYGRLSSGRSAYEATPIKEYNRSDSPRVVSSRRVSYVGSAHIIDEDMRIGRMHLPPVIRCECNGKEAYALISSSETVSTISLDFVRKLRLLDQIIPETSHVFNPLSLHQQELKGKVKYIDLSIGSWQQVAQFNIVENYISDITLGIDFLRRTQSVVNFEDSSLIVGSSKGERIPFLNSREVMSIARRTANKTTNLFNGNGLSESSVLSKNSIQDMTER